MDQLITTITDFWQAHYLDIMSPNALWVMVISILLNLIFCHEKLLNRAMKSPTAILERTIDSLENRYNNPELTEESLKADGISAAIFLFLLACFIGFLLNSLHALVPYFWILGALFIASSMTIRMTIQHANHLINALGRSTMEARATLSLMSGRDSEEMEKTDVARAGIEYLARTIATGILAPIGYFLIAGYLGLFVYKVFYLASYMLDVRDQLSKNFGIAATRVHDLLVLPFSLLAFLVISLITLISRKQDFFQSVKVALQQSQRISQGFAVWPIGAFAGALGLKLGGPICFENFCIDKDWIGTGMKEADQMHIQSALKTLKKATALLLILLLVGASIGIQMPIDHFFANLSAFIQSF